MKFGTPRRLWKKIEDYLFGAFFLHKWIDGAKQLGNEVFKGEILQTGIEPTTRSEAAEGLTLSSCAASQEMDEF